MFREWYVVGVIVGFFESRYWDRVWGLSCLLENNSYERRGKDLGLSRGRGWSTI